MQSRMRTWRGLPATVSATHPKRGPHRGLQFRSPAHPEHQRARHRYGSRACSADSGSSANLDSAGRAPVSGRARPHGKHNAIPSISVLSGRGHHSSIVYVGGAAAMSITARPSENSKMAPLLSRTVPLRPRSTTRARRPASGPGSQARVTGHPILPLSIGCGWQGLPSRLPRSACLHAGGITHPGLAGPSCPIMSNLSLTQGLLCDENTVPISVGGGSVQAADMAGPGIPDGDRSPRQRAAAGTRHGLYQGSGREKTPMPQSHQQD